MFWPIFSERNKIFQKWNTDTLILKTFLNYQQLKSTHSKVCLAYKTASFKVDFVIHLRCSSDIVFGMTVSQPQGWTDRLLSWSNYLDASSYKASQIF